ncbi:MAG: hypothetical protein D6736_06210 [Nitrospinota bacterium]|nr:MAG: hypothetical protein D6736_06210 [Nitrospinota bacterium]
MPTFTCPSCGGQELQISHRYVLAIHYNRVVPCACGRTSHGLAAVRSSRKLVTCQEWGNFDAERHWVQEGGRICQEEDQEDQVTIFCSSCLEGVEEEDWESVDQETVVDPESHAFSLCCALCHREVEPSVFPPE